jgi:hypothetical protein
LEQKTLLDYAANYWFRHAFTIQEDVSELACTLLQNNELVSSAIQVINELIPEADFVIYLNQSSGLHFTARFGLVPLTRILLPRLDVHDLNRTDVEGRTALSRAAEKAAKN